jgi:hypothetical protein
LEKNYGLVPPFSTALLTDSPTGITDGTHRRKSHIPKRMPVRSTITDSIIGGTISDGNFRRNYRRIKKKAVFSKILVRISIYFRRNYRRKLMPPTTINVPSVIPTKILAYKTLPPSPHFIFCLGSHLYFFSSPFEFNFLKSFDCFGGSFQHIKRYVMVFLYLSFF